MALVPRLGWMAEQTKFLEKKSSMKEWDNNGLTIGQVSLLPSVPGPQVNFFGIHLSRISKVQLHWDLFFSIEGAIRGTGHKKVYFFYDNHITPHLIHGFTPARLHGNPHSNSTLFNYSVNLRCAAAGGLICLCS